MLVLVALWIGAQGPGTGTPVWRRVTLPWFILGFLALVALNSAVAVPIAISAAMMTLSKALLLFAVIATAMRSDLSLILGLGWRAVMPVVGATLASFLTALTAVWLGVV